ncbi:hypothetical protein CEXT_353241 [Caerostris extrusa]|uniref:Uncharacterized protein n=1 Tax=Caerostris extrusa TaxID=172846 RepID=A0AAV4VZA1_CAEEX|nr:hypothetical protein CEXT_353241 [Caerostris extrusa]
MNPIIKSIKCTKENLILLITDNHAYHVIIMERGEKTGIMVIIIPPRCSLKLQPLDVCLDLDVWTWMDLGSFGCLFFLHLKTDITRFVTIDLQTTQKM